MSIKLILHDEVNCQFEGLEPEHVVTCVDSLKYFVKGYFTQASFKAGVWDGKESLMDYDGVTYIYMIDDVLDILSTKCGIDLSTINIDDRRKEIDLSDIKPVDKNYLKEFFPFDLRPYQVDIINLIPSGEIKGIVHAGTTAGKTLATLGISRILHNHMKSIVIVPSATLAKQTYADYIKTDLKDSTILLPTVKPDDREDAIKNNRHIITTTKLFQNCIGMFDEDYAIIYDEAHVLGEVTMGCLRYDMGHCPVRIGFTGTLPTDKLKHKKLLCLLGGDTVVRVEPSFLVSEGYASSFEIEVVTTSHKEIEKEILDLSNDDDIDGAQVFALEDKYLLTNKKRIRAIADYIKELDLSKNTLVLCKPQLGKELAAIFGYEYVDKDMNVDKRDSIFANFDEHKNNVIVFASFGTSSTGISKNRIHRLINIDVGKDEVTILQSIGRGMRLDGEGNTFDVIDISADTKYSRRHRKERLKVYDRESYPYRINKNFILVE